jgi:DNA invertase Pin-like site-specific DNA recombinase
MKNAVIYARFSSYNQQEQSIEGQVRACKEYAARNDLKIVKEYCDRAKSGTNSKRPALQEMLREAETGSFDVVLVYQYDRFSRNRRESLNNEFILQTLGVKLVSINERIDEEDSSSVIIKGMFESLAEYYSKDLSRKVKRGIKESIIHRKSIGGVRWLGYKTDAEMKFYIDESEAETVRLIFNMRATGHHAEEIADYLNKKAIKNKGVTFNKNAIIHILKNEKYTGRYVNPYDPTEVITDMYPKIIERKLFDAVQDTFKRYRLNSCRGIKNPSNYYLSGKLFSAVNGALFTGVSGYSANGKKYGYYKANINGVIVKYPQKDLEDEVIDGIKKIVSTHDYLEYLADQMIKDFAARSNSSRPREIRTRINQIQKKIDSIGEAFLDADTNMRRLLNNKLNDLQDELSKLQEEESYYFDEKLKLSQSKDLIKLFIRELLEKDYDDPKNRSSFFKLMLNSCFIVDNHIDIYLNFDVSKQISFAEYKNDTLKLESVRSASYMAASRYAETNIYSSHFYKNKLSISIDIQIKHRKTSSIKATASSLTL